MFTALTLLGKLYALLALGLGIEARRSTAWDSWVSGFSTFLLMLSVFSVFSML